MQPPPTGLILAAVTGVLAYLLHHAARGAPAADAHTGSLVFRHHAFVRALSWVFSLVAPLAISVLLIFQPPKNDGDAWAAASIFLLILGLGVPLLWESYRYALVSTPEGLYCRSPWRSRQFIRWDEVRYLSYNVLLGWFVIRAVDGRTFRLPYIIVGASFFLEECERRLTPEQLRRAKFGYRQLGRTFPG